jgi:hypothetical protein
MTVLLMGLCLAAGIILGWLLPAFKSLRFSQQVDVGNVLNALATLAVAILINFLYTRSASAKKSETDLLLEHVRSAQAALRSLLLEATNCQNGKKLTKEQQLALNRAERTLSNDVHSLEQALLYCGCKLHTVDFGRLKDARSELKEILTDTPFPGPYDETSIGKINVAFKSVRDELTRLTFAIPRR